ncbi:hypothetical protein [Xanthomonas sacchari]|nr:hypothetical protein [Xanthomonas sacchari]MDV0438621.1 hypothetical protein [Xanthomonas sacchari]
MQMLTTLLFQLPVVVVYVVGMALLATRRPGRPRTLGLCGLSLMLVVMLLGTALSMLPMWLMSRGASLSQFTMWLGVLRAVLSLMLTVGVLLVVLALRFALPPRVAAPH